MAYITKQEVQAKTPKLKALCKEYGVKASFSGSNSISLTLTVQSGSIDFIENYISTTLQQLDDQAKERLRLNQNLQVNHYYLDRQFTGKALEFLQKAYAIMLEGHKDDSDVMTDYFNCSWYNHINVGKWNKGYEYKPCTACA